MASPAVASSEKALRQIDYVTVSHIKRLGCLAFGCRSYVEHLCALPAIHEANEVHLSQVPILIGTACFHDSLKHGRWPVERDFRGLIYCAGDDYVYDTAFQSNDDCRILKLWLITQSQFILEACDVFASSIDISDHG